MDYLCNKQRLSKTNNNCYWQSSLHSILPAEFYFQKKKKKLLAELQIPENFGVLFHK
jgi:hypothetical protein